jgi:8-oxo-dGTP pyrophosphatase MutT (NUDIX family)
MSYLDRIADCNTFDLQRYLPFEVAGARVGLVRKDFAALLAPYPQVFSVQRERLALVEGLDDFTARSAAVEPVLRELAAQGHILGWREEPLAVTESFSAAPLMQIERAAANHLGVRTFGVHMNGFVRSEDGLHMWIPRRSRTKPTYPGRLDNMVAGGQPIGKELLDNLIKECAEEANIPAVLARRALPVGLISYCAEVPEGLQPDVEFCFDLELPEDFVPRNTDGEVEEFQLLPIAQVAELVRDTREFKPNCALVVIHFLLRHGLLPPEHPEYVELAQRLASPTLPRVPSELT